jgi:hypothetical protein
VHVLDHHAVKPGLAQQPSLLDRALDQLRDGIARGRTPRQRADVDHADERARDTEGGRDGLLRVHQRPGFRKR